MGWAFGQSAWYGGKVTSALLKLVKAFVATISVGVATISVQGAEFQLRWALAVWHYYYEGRATPWFALGATVSTWGRLNITAQVGIFIPGTPINFGVTVWSGYTPAFKLPGSCFGWLYFYNNVLESGGACGLV